VDEEQIVPTLSPEPWPVRHRPWPMIHAVEWRQGPPIC
jgi:hypothetical protein